MSEFPALKDALVRAAARRRRRRRTVGAAVPAFAVAASALAFVLAPSAQEEQERVASPLAERFSVFARPQTDADRALPERVARAGTGGTTDLALTRRVADGAYLLATREGSVCIVMPERGNQIKVSCGPVARAAAGDAPVITGTAKQTVRLVADGTRDVIVTHGDGSRSEVPVRDNVIVVPDPDDARVVSWTDATGVRHIDRVGTLRFATAKRCVGVFPFEAPPRDAERLAARAALLDAFMFSDTSTSAKVIATEPAPSTPCSDAISRRLVQVTLQFDAGRRVVLVGWVKGTAQTFVIPR